MIYTFAAGGTLGRPLRLGVEGWGVASLQHALGLQPDGYFGATTDKAVTELQREHKLVVDGIAGPQTKRVATLLCLWPQQKEFATPPGLLRGLVEGESGYAPDAQSVIYEHPERPGVPLADLSVTQWQTAIEDTTEVRQHIDVNHALAHMAGDASRGMRPRHDRYYEQAWVKAQAARHEWAWRLAIGSWNAPSWTDTWAKLGPNALTVHQREHLAEYIGDKAVYVKEWTA